MSASDRVFECDYLYCDEPRTDGRFCEKHASEYAVIAPKKPDAHWVPKEQYDALQAELARMQVERDVLWVALRGFGGEEEDGEWHASECWNGNGNGTCGYAPCRGARVALAGVNVPAAPQPEEGNAG